MSRLARRASLLALGVLAVHQLRYALAYGGAAPAALARQGHAYLADLAPTLVALALSVVAARLLAAAVGRARGAERRASPLRRDTLAFATALLGIFAAQELTEGALAAGHPAGIAAIAANGGWVAVPLAVAIGLVIAIADLFLDGAERKLADRAEPRRRPRPCPAAIAQPPMPHRAPLACRCLPFGLARRPPPALAVS